MGEQDGLSYPAKLEPDGCLLSTLIKTPEALYKTFVFISESDPQGRTPGGN